MVFLKRPSSTSGNFSSKVQRTSSSSSIPQPPVVASSQTTSRARLELSHSLEDTDVATWYNETTKFVEVMNDCGIKLSNTVQQQSKLFRDPSLIVQELTMMYEKAQYKDSFIEMLVDGFERYIRTPNRLQVAVMPTSFQPNANDNTEGLPPSSSDSIVHLLLNVVPLQSRVAAVLTDKLSIILERKDPAYLKTSIDISRLILDQFRYLDSVQDGETICNRFLDILPFCSKSMKAEILSCLPQLVDGTQQADNVANKLRRIIESDKSFFGLALETIGNFPLSPEAIALLQAQVLDEYMAYSMEEKVAAFQFLLQTAEASKDIDKLLLEMHGLDFGDLGEPAGKVDLLLSQSSNRASAKTNVITVALQLATAVDKAFKRSKTLCESAFRVESQLCNKGEEDKFFDVIAMLALILTKRSRQVCALIRNKLRKRCWKTEMMEELFRHPEVTRLYSKSVSEVADYLISLPDKRLSTFGADLYMRLFIVVNTNERQDIIVTLVTRVCSGKDREVNDALEALEKLSNANEIIEFDMVLQGLLDAVPSLKLHQVRKVFAFFGKLAKLDEGDSVAALDNLHIFAQKGINCESLRSRAMGILASLTLYRHMSSIRDVKDQATALYKLADRGSSDNTTLRVMFYDELSNAINSGDIKNKRFLGDLKSNLLCVLESNFIEKLSPTMWADMVNNGKLVGASSGTQSIALKITKDKNDPDVGKKNADKSPFVLPSILRLFFLCEWHINGNFNDVDLLLSCPIILHYRENWAKFSRLMPEEQNALCLELLCSIDCLVELINGLSVMPFNNETGKLMVSRMNDLVILISELEGFLRLPLSFTLSKKGFSNLENDDAICRKTASVARNKPNALKRPSKKKGEPKISQQTTCTALISQVVERSICADNADDAGPSHKRDSEMEHSTPSKIQDYIRDLDITVWSVLKLPLVCEESENDHSPEGYLTPPILAYILSNLASKIDCLEVSAGNRGQNFMAAKHGTSSEILEAITLQKVNEQLVIVGAEIWKHMINSLKYFKSIAEQNDGIIDGLATQDRQSVTIAKCMELGTACLTKYLTWIEDNETVELLHKVLASFLPEQVHDNQNMVQKVNFTVSTLLEFADYVPSILLAEVLLRMARTLAKIVFSKENELKISEIADGYLKREWDLEDVESTNANKALKNLIEVSLSGHTAKDCLSKIESRIDALTAFSRRIPNVDIDWKSMTNGTLYTWYRALFIKLISTAKDCPRAKTCTEPWLEHWATVARAFNLIVFMAVKPDSPRQILAAALFHSSPIVNLFTVDVVPVLEKTFFNIYPKTVKQLFSVVQKATRALHDICVESKLKQDRYLCKFVPPLKRVLESFVFRVKAMMAVNNCADALTIGLLKNKNLSGETILSQRSTNVNETDETPDETEGTDHETTSDKDEDVATEEGDEVEDENAIEDEDGIPEVDDDEDREGSGSASWENEDRNDCDSVDSDTKHSVCY